MIEAKAICLHLARECRCAFCLVWQQDISIPVAQEWGTALLQLAFVGFGMIVISFIERTLQPTC